MEDSRIIAAYSGGSLPAAIGIVRMSGKGSIELLSKIFRPKGKKSITECDNGSMIYGELLARDGQTLDICLACTYRAPKSYTGEDMAEIFCHGSEAIVAAALGSACGAGARLAEAGEFTRRAFLNGKMNLSDAEAVADLIYSRTEQGAKNAAALLKGTHSRALSQMREEILGLIAHFYAVCDYSDEDIEPFEYQNACNILETICAGLDGLYQGYLRSSSLAEGIPVAVIGRPNVGKSSLFNALAGFERAIVTDEEGTTRDVVGHRISLEGRDFSLMDTAGVRQGQSLAEEMGIERSRRAAQQAALVVAVFDGSTPMTRDDNEIIDLCRGKNALAVLNKRDLGGWDKALLAGDFDSVLEVSAKSGAGVQDVADWLCQNTPKSREVLITSRRQAELIKSALEALTSAAASARQGMTADAFLLDAETGARLIGKVLGHDVDPDITEGIFSRFCVGK